MARRGFRLPIIGNISTKNKWILWGGLGLLGLAALAWSGRSTGIRPIDWAVGEFEDIYGGTLEPYLGPLGPGEAGVPIGPVSAAPVVPSAPGPAATRGMAFDDMVFSGAYATDSPLPYQDWWTTDISEDDRIIIA